MTSDDKGGLVIGLLVAIGVLILVIVVLAYLFIFKRHKEVVIHSKIPEATTNNTMSNDSELNSVSNLGLTSDATHRVMRPVDTERFARPVVELTRDLVITDAELDKSIEAIKDLRPMKDILNEVKLMKYWPRFEESQVLTVHDFLNLD